MKGITICVDYDDLLRITLVRNMRHLTECVVVTATNDERTCEVASQVPCVHVLRTDAFYRDGAKFNKGAAMEEGFELLGRDGLIAIFDADTLFPDVMPMPNLHRGCLHSANRLILEDPTKWHLEFDWKQASRTREYTFAGFLQIFYGDDPRLVDLRPWYDVDFTHAGGGDHYFAELWPTELRRNLPFNVLHLGPRDTNWYGRCSPRVDGAPTTTTFEDMDRLVRAKGWCGYSPDGTYVEEKIKP